MTDAVGDVTPEAGSALPEPAPPSNVVNLPNGHTVTLHPKVTIPLGIAALSVVKQGGGQAAIEGGLAEVYLRLGIESWDFPEPINAETVDRLLPYSDGGLEVAEAADALYSEVVFRPLAKRIASFSAITQRVGSMSPSSPGGSTRPVQSKRSSRNGSAGKRSAGRAR